MLTSFLFALYLSSAITSMEAVSADGSAFHLALVTNLFSNDVSILDTRTHTEITRISTGPRPTFVAMSADGRFAYVGEDGQTTMNPVVHRVDLDTLSIAGTLIVPGGSNSCMTELEISPDGSLLAVGNNRTMVFGVDTATMQVIWSRRLCAECPRTNSAGCHVVFTSDSRVLWVSAESEEGGLAGLDSRTGQAIGIVPLPPGEISYGYINLYPGLDRQPLVSHQLKSVVRVFEGVSGAFLDLPIPPNYTLQETEVSDALGLIATASAAFGSGPNCMRVFVVPGFSYFDVPAPDTWTDLEFHPSNGEIWVESASGVTPIDVLARTPGDLIPISGGIPSTGTPPAFTQDGLAYYYPRSGFNTIAVIDVATKRVILDIVVGDNPRGVYMQGDSRPHP